MDFPRQRLWNSLATLLKVIHGNSVNADLRIPMGIYCRKAFPARFITTKENISVDGNYVTRITFWFLYSTFLLGSRRRVF
jgi:hypothetical protein